MSQGNGNGYNAFADLFYELAARESGGTGEIFPLRAEAEDLENKDKFTRSEGDIQYPMSSFDQQIMMKSLLKKSSEDTGTNEFDFEGSVYLLNYAYADPANRSALYNKLNDLDLDVLISLTGQHLSYARYSIDNPEANDAVSGELCLDLYRICQKKISESGLREENQRKIAEYFVSTVNIDMTEVTDMKEVAGAEFEIMAAVRLNQNKLKELDQAKSEIEGLATLFSETQYTSDFIGDLIASDSLELLDQVNVELQAVGADVQRDGFRIGRGEEILARLAVITGQVGDAEKQSKRNAGGRGERTPSESEAANIEKISEINALLGSLKSMIEAVRYSMTGVQSTPPPHVAVKLESSVDALKTWTRETFTRRREARQDNFPLAALAGNQVPGQTIFDTYKALLESSIGLRRVYAKLASDAQPLVEAGDLSALVNGIALLEKLQAYRHSNEFVADCSWRDRDKKIQKVERIISDLEKSIRASINELPQDRAAEKSTMLQVIDQINPKGVHRERLSEVGNLRNTLAMRPDLYLDEEAREIIQNEFKNRSVGIAGCETRSLGDLFQKSKDSFVSQMMVGRQDREFNYSAEPSKTSVRKFVEKNLSAESRLTEGCTSFVPFGAESICAIDHVEMDGTVTSNFYVKNPKSVQNMEPNFYMQWAAEWMENCRSKMSLEVLDSHRVALTRGPEVPDEFVYAVQAYCRFNGYPDPRVRRGEGNDPFQESTKRVGVYTNYIETHQPMMEDKLGMMLGHPDQIVARIKGTTESLRIMAEIDYAIVESGKVAVRPSEEVAKSVFIPLDPGHRKSLDGLPAVDNLQPMGNDQDAAIRGAPSIEGNMAVPPPPGPPPAVARSQAPVLIRSNVGSKRPHSEEPSQEPPHTATALDNAGLFSDIRNKKPRLRSVQDGDRLREEKGGRRGVEDSSSQSSDNTSAKSAPSLQENAIAILRKNANVDVDEGSVNNSDEDTWDSSSENSPTKRR